MVLFLINSITVMFFAKEGKECNLIATKEDLFPSTTVSFSKGSGQRFKQPCGKGIGLSALSETELVEASEGDVYHVAVTAEASSSSSEDNKPESKSPNRRITHAVLEKDKGEYKARVVKQILWVNGNKYVLQEIYGIGCDNTGEDGSESGKECVICLTEPRDTTVLPCRHMVSNKS